MNKKKNKNRPSKPSNPVPAPVPQTTETQPTETQPTLEEPVILPVEEKPEIRESEPVIESVSEVTSPIKEQNNLADDAPKKPKRNKAKKKKQDDSILDEGKSTPEPVSVPDSEVKDEDKEIKETKVKEDDKKIGDNITPNVRKKKNKKKQNEQLQAVEEMSKETATIEKLEAEITEKKIEDTTLVASPEPPVPQPTEPESKQTKKKNKKKKHRHDSEKSDKADETITCTAAFQKLIGSGEEDEVVKSEEVSDDKAAKEIIEEGSKVDIPKEENLKELIESVLMPEVTQESQPEIIKDDIPKGKKKNKKDKKQSQKQEPVKSSLIEEEKAQEPLVSDTEVISKEIKNESVQNEETSLIIPLVSVSREPSPKPKAKIAKPVEKKRKGKTNEDTHDLKSREDTFESMEKSDTSKAEANILDTPKAEVDILDTPKADTVILDTPKVKADIPDTPKKEVDILDSSKAEEDILETAKADLDKLDTPKADPFIAITELEDRKVESSLSLGPESINPITTFEDILDQKIDTSVPEIEQTKVEDMLFSIIEQVPPETLTVSDPMEEIAVKKMDDVLSVTEEKTSEFMMFAEDAVTPMDLISTTIKTDITDTPEEKTAISTDEIIPHMLQSMESVPVKLDQLLGMDSNIPLISPMTTEPDGKDRNILRGFESVKSEQLLEMDSNIPLISPTTTKLEDKDKNIPSELAPEKSEQLLEMDSSIPFISATITDLEDKNINISSEFVPIKPDQISEMGSLIPPVSPTTMEIEDKDRNIPSVPETKKERKKKKHPKKIDTSPGSVLTENISDYKVLLTPDCTKEKSVEKENVGVFFDSSSTGDIEISTAKAEDLEGSSDVTPDFIHHPLSTSQQLIDNNNNNMIITEITTPDEKISLPLLMPSIPIIQGSGETPEPLSEISTEPKLTRIQRSRSKTNEPEKTDLKSKMMEVSQDMEELRLSIERSLAELTSMEKSEQEVERKFEERKLTEQFDVPSEPTFNISLEENLPCTLNKPLYEGNKDVQIQESIGPKSEPELGNAECKIEKPDFTSDTSRGNIENVVIPTAPIEPPKMGSEGKGPSPVAPARKEHKGKGKGKRKGKQETQSQQTTSASQSTSVTSTERTSQDVKKEEKTEQKDNSSETNQNKGKQQSLQAENGCNGGGEICDPTSSMTDQSFEPIENFEDALTSSVDDVNQTFELIANDASTTEMLFQNPEINIIAPTEDTEKDVKPKQNPVSPPKNLLGHPDIPVPSNRTDYKKEKNKPPNTRQAKVKIKDAVDIEKEKSNKRSKESQTENKMKPSKDINVLESFTYMTNENEEYVYKYSFRKVFLQSLCHVCRKTLSQRVPCQFCSLVFYCSQKHKDEDWPQHQSLCFAVCTIVHLKDQKHIYADAKNITGQNYRLLRMQMIVSCEKVLKRKLVPWEQEAFLYPRICADVTCREWKQSKLVDCDGCGQISYCSDNPDHLPASHQRWCKSYSLYQKLVHHQQTKGRLEPKMPTRVLAEGYQIPENMNEILALMYEEKIDMSDTEYAALTQLATAPLTAAYCHQLTCNVAYSNQISKKTSFVIHIVGAELQFEADVLHKWETFFLHLKPDVKELRVVLINPELNPSKLPLELLGKINMCENCRTNKRRVLFSFQDKKTYYEYWSSDEFISPDIVCAFNPSIQRSSTYNVKDTWPTTISCILKLKTPFLITAYSLNELNRDVSRIKECSRNSGLGCTVISEAKSNNFASVRPDRNFITDHEIPLLFKNYCVAVVSGV